MTCQTITSYCIEFPNAQVKANKAPWHPPQPSFPIAKYLTLKEPLKGHTFSKSTLRNDLLSKETQPRLHSNACLAREAGERGAYGDKVVLLLSPLPIVGTRHASSHLQPISSSRPTTPNKYEDALRLIRSMQRNKESLQTGIKTN